MSLWVCCSGLQRPLADRHSLPFPAQVLRLRRTLLRRRWGVPPAVPIGLSPPPPSVPFLSLRGLSFPVYLPLPSPSCPAFPVSGAVAERGSLGRAFACGGPAARHTKGPRFRATNALRTKQFHRFVCPPPMLRGLAEKGALWALPKSPPGGGGAFVRAQCPVCPQRGSLPLQRGSRGRIWLSGGIAPPPPPMPAAGGCGLGSAASGEVSIEGGRPPLPLG